MRNYLLVVAVVFAQISCESGKSKFSNLNKKSDTLNNFLVARLDTIFNDDQQYRLQIESIDKKYGVQSPEMKELERAITETDSINISKVKDILDQYGWLGAGVVGQKGNSTLFLVIQHADQATQEKYLPLLENAVKEGNANASDLALLQDRVALAQGKKQVYGSQIGRDMQTGLYYVLPLEDPENVDKRRRNVGLEPMENYLSHWQIKWNAEQYKKDLPTIEAKEKLQYK